MQNEDIPEPGKAEATIYLTTNGKVSILWRMGLLERRNLKRFGLYWACRNLEEHQGLSPCSLKGQQ